jgi:hypothetical protein
VATVVLVAAPDRRLIDDQPPKIADKSTIRSLPPAFSSQIIDLSRITRA